VLADHPDDGDLSAGGLPAGAASMDAVVRPLRTIGIAVTVIGLICGIVLWRDASADRHGPLTTTESEYKAITGVVPTGLIDYASLVVVNPTDYPAMITRIDLLTGGGGAALMEEAEFFVLGLERRIDGGGADAPTGARMWGVEPVPAIGYEIPGADVDTEGEGVNILLRVGPGAASSGSFKGVDIHYVWQRQSYVLRSGASMLICQVGPNLRLPPPCHPNSKAPVVGGDGQGERESGEG